MLHSACLILRYFAVIPTAQEGVRADFCTGLHHPAATPLCQRYGICFEERRRAWIRPCCQRRGMVRRTYRALRCCLLSQKRITFEHVHTIGVTIQQCGFCGSERKQVPQLREKFCPKCRSARREAARAFFQVEEYPSARVGKFLLSTRPKG